ncbi:outer membrane beta-barrel protein [Hymenobacter sp. GOD-10R]|uniref:outer membrane beta-barrel protein n=1 Tax=Hymenobacter sp. GOD-10R TaxID=3093922 RepID=UPI002D770E8C|nr:outer membrane beta-barrel protein [Hymenobacter sp. GOD-10R]WRQ27384.1 outer membrane beta-barrel protein [Hymenobacter sp. GOD-10R]
MRPSLLPACAQASRLAFLLFLCLLIGVSAVAQTTISGRVLDQQKQEALSFANVVLKAAGSESVVQTALADETGRFSLKNVKPGSYQLQILMIGFVTHVQAVQLSAGIPSLDLGTLGLAATAQKLGEVVVTGQRPLIEQKPDRVTMNVDGSILAAGNDAYDILAAAPSVQLIDGRLTFRGKGNVLILLNGKRLPSGTNLETLLASIPGDQIERIELISNPSAKYDADASGGVIEIYTKRAKELGWTANVGANFRQGYRTGAGLNSGVRVSTPKLDLAVNGSFNRRDGFERSTSSRTIYEGLTPAADLAQRGDLNKTILNSSFSASLNYHFSPSMTLGFDVDVLHSSLDGAGWTQSYITQSKGLTTSRMQESVLLQDAFSNYTLFYKHKLDSLGSALLLTSNYATYQNKQQQTFDQLLQGPQDSVGVASTFRNFIPATYHISTTAADYTKVWNPNTRLEAGLKYTDTRNQSRQDAATLADGNWVAQALSPFSKLGYQERVAAGYFSLNQTIGKLGLQAGLRAERTHYRVVSGIDSSYFNLFPNLRADYKVSDDFTTSLAYAKNIRRPAYESLIPYERFQDTYSTSRGNASLRPEYLHSFSWNNLYKGFGLQLAYTQTVGAISSVYLYDAATLRLTTTQQNLAHRHLATATLTAPFTPAKWWTMNNSASVFYQELNFPSPLDNTMNLTKRKTYYMLSSDNTLTWGKGWSVRVYGLYNSPSMNGLFDWDAYSYVSVGVKKTFLNKRASLNLSVADLFYDTNPRVTSTIVPVVLSEMYRNDTRQVRLAFTFNFGKADLKSKRVETKSNADERGRLGM